MNGVDEIVLQCPTVIIDLGGGKWAKCAGDDSEETVRKSMASLFVVRRDIARGRLELANNTRRSLKGEVQRKLHFSWWLGTIYRLVPSIYIYRSRRSMGAHGNQREWKSRAGGTKLIFVAILFGDGPSASRPSARPPPRSERRRDSLKLTMAGFHFWKLFIRQRERAGSTLQTETGKEAQGPLFSPFSI